jgi:hypothetical protein
MVLPDPGLVIWCTSPAGKIPRDRSGEGEIVTREALDDLSRKPLLVARPLHEELAMMSIREARLRPEGAERYPGVPVDVWVPAFRAASDSQTRAATGALATQARQRILADEVFEFRGGAPELALRRRARTRWADYPGPVTGTHRTLPAF